MQPGQTVAQFFEARHRITLERPEWPLIRTLGGIRGTSTASQQRQAETGLRPWRHGEVHVSYYPLEVIDLLPISLLDPAEIRPFSLPPRRPPRSRSPSIDRNPREPSSVGQYRSVGSGNMGPVEKTGRGYPSAQKKQKDHGSRIQPTKRAGPHIPISPFPFHSVPSTPSGCFRGRWKSVGWEGKGRGGCKKHPLERIKVQPPNKKWLADSSEPFRRGFKMGAGIFFVSLLLLSGTVGSCPFPFATIGRTIPSQLFCPIRHFISTPFSNSIISPLNFIPPMYSDISNSPSPPLPPGPSTLTVPSLVRFPPPEVHPHRWPVRGGEESSGGIWDGKPNSPVTGIRPSPELIDEIKKRMARLARDGTKEVSRRIEKCLTKRWGTTYPPSDVLPPNIPLPMWIIPSSFPISVYMTLDNSANMNENNPPPPTDILRPHPD